MEKINKNKETNWLVERIFLGTFSYCDIIWMMVPNVKSIECK